MRVQSVMGWSGRTAFLQVAGQRTGGTNYPFFRLRTSGTGVIFGRQLTTRPFGSYGSAACALKHQFPPIGGRLPLSFRGREAEPGTYIRQTSREAPRRAASSSAPSAFMGPGLAPAARPGMTVGGGRQPRLPFPSNRRKTGLHRPQPETALPCPSTRTPRPSTISPSGARNRSRR